MSNLVLPCFRPSCWKFISIPRWTILFEPAQHEEFVTENIFAPILFSPWHSLFENKGKFLGPPAYGTAAIAVSSKFPVSKRHCALLSQFVENLFKLVVYRHEVTFSVSQERDSGVSIYVWLTD